MERFRDVLLDVWREACRHIEIAESTAAIAPMLAHHLPLSSGPRPSARWRTVGTRYGRTGADRTGADPGGHAYVAYSCQARPLNRMVSFGGGAPHAAREAERRPCRPRAAGTRRGCNCRAAARSGRPGWYARASSESPQDVQATAPADGSGAARTVRRRARKRSPPARTGRLAQRPKRTRARSFPVSVVKTWGKQSSAPTRDCGW